MASDGNEHHQSVVYASRLSIKLGRAQSVKELYNIYIINNKCFVVERIAFYSKYTWWGGALGSEVCYNLNNCTINVNNCTINVNLTRDLANLGLKLM